MRGRWWVSFGVVADCARAVRFGCWAKRVVFAPMQRCLAVLAPLAGMLHNDSTRPLRLFPGQPCTPEWAHMVQASWLGVASLLAEGSVHCGGRKGPAGGEVATPWCVRLVRGTTGGHVHVQNGHRTSPRIRTWSPTVLLIWPIDAYVPSADGMGGFHQGLNVPCRRSGSARSARA